MQARGFQGLYLSSKFEKYGLSCENDMSLFVCVYKHKSIVVNYRRKFGWFTMRIESFMWSFLTVKVIVYRFFPWLLFFPVLSRNTKKLKGPNPAFGSLFTLPSVDTLRPAPVTVAPLNVTDSEDSHRDPFQQVYLRPPRHT